MPGSENKVSSHGSISRAAAATASRVARSIVCGSLS
jgi:hypothetical protein